MPRRFFVAAPLALLLASGSVTIAQTGAPAATDVQTPMHDTSALTQEPTPERTSDLARPAADAGRLAREARYREHITTLANPAFEGRAPGTRGNRMAADYLEFWYTKVGLKPAFSVVANQAMLASPKNDSVEPTAHLLASGGERSYRQVFVAPLSRRPGDSVRIDTQSFSYAQGGDSLTLAPGTHYNVLGYSGNASLNAAPLVFVGYGIEDDSNEYFSFDKPKDWAHEAEAGKPLAGRIAVLLRFEPLDEQGNSRFSDDGRLSPASGIDGKLRRTIAKGAAGIILVNPPGANDPRTGRMEDLSFGLSERSLSVPVVMMSQEAADSLLKAADAQGRGLMELRKVVDERGELIDLPRTTASLNVSVSRTPTVTDNVGAVLPGAGTLANEWIVIGSHYDHVGYGYFGSREPEKRGTIHPGADDNASGTSANLLLAERLSAAFGASDAPGNRRSILFLQFCAEESGLNGARYYTQRPIAPMGDHALMVNLDMVGRVRDNKVEVNGVGTGEGMEEWTRGYFEPSHLTIAPKKSGLGPSDHNVFSLAGVPVLFFFSGLHNEYHKPSDTSDLINVPGAVDIADLVYDMVVDASTRPTRFAFTSANGRPKGDAGAQAADPNANNDQPVTGMQGVGVRFGIAPGDYSGDKPGVLVGDVMPDLPAAKAGIKSGDLMTSWNGKALDSVEGWMPLLMSHKPGDEVEIVIVRDGKEQTVKATLVARDRGGR
jgi:hypothetical protein